MGNFGIPSEKAGLLLSNIFQSAPGVAQERRLPDLAFDLASCVASMKVTDAVRQQVVHLTHPTHTLAVASQPLGMLRDLAIFAGGIPSSSPDLTRFETLQVKTSLQTNNVLTVSDARNKRCVHLISAKTSRRQSHAFHSPLSFVICLRTRPLRSILADFLCAAECAHQ